MNAKELLVRKDKAACFIVDEDGQDVTSSYPASLPSLHSLSLSSFTLRALGFEDRLYPYDCLELDGEDLSEISQEERVQLFSMSLPQTVDLAELVLAAPPEVKLFRPFTPLKARTGYGLFEFNNERDLYELWAKERLEQKRAIAVQPKYDGMRLLIHREGDKVAIYTEDKKRDRAEYLPDIVAEVGKLPGKSCILDTEFVVWREEAPIPRQEMIYLIVGKQKVKDEDIRVNVHDCLLVDGAALNSKPYKERLEALEKLLSRDQKHLRAAETWTADNRTEFMAALKKASEYPGSEGAMVKTLDSTYSIRGRAREETADWGKLKLVYSIDVEIVGRTRKPNPWPAGKKPERNLEGDQALKEFRQLQKESETYYYRCAIRSNGKLVPIESDHKVTPGDLALKWDAEHEGGVWKGTDDPAIWEMAKGWDHRQRGEYAYGNTYAIKLEPSPGLGDIITVVPILMRSWKTPDGETHYSWTFPRVLEHDPTKTKPDSTEEADRIVQASPRSLKKSTTPRPFGSPGGKTLLLKHILPLVPQHETYCEPYCGAATVFFAKEKAQKSVLGDLDPDIIFAFRFIRDLERTELEWLRKQNWRPSKGRWKFLMNQKPLRKQEQFYRFLYLRYNSWADAPSKGFAAHSNPRRFEPEVLQLAGQKLKGSVTLVCQDAFKTMREHDSLNTFHYLDPEYPGGGDPKAFYGKAPELQELARFLKGLRGRWLLSLADTKAGRDAFKNHHIKVVTIGRRYSTLNVATGTGQPMKTRRELLIANYDISKPFKESYYIPKITKEHPEQAEEGFGWCVTWAEGRAITCYTTHAEAEKFAAMAEEESGGGDVVEFKYCELKTGWRRRTEAPSKEELIKEAEAPKGEGGEGLTREEQREEAEKLFGDPYLVRQPPDKTFPFADMTHERGIWTDDELAQLRKELTKAREDPSLIPEIWKDYKPAILTTSLDQLSKEAQAVADKRGNVSTAVHRHLDEKPPKALPPNEKILNVGNVHHDWRMRSPEGEWAIGMTLDTPSIVLQFVDGKYVYPVRDKFLENQPDDKILAHRKCDNPLCDEERYLHLVESNRELIESAPEVFLEGEEITLPASSLSLLACDLADSSISFLFEDRLTEATQPLIWLTIVNPKRVIYWAPAGAVGATKKTGARFVFRDRGKWAAGTRKSDYHEGYFWFEKHKKLSGRWGAQLLPGRPEYEKIGDEAEWWMVNRPHETQEPYILQFSKATKEKQAREEKLKHIIWNPNLLKVLKADPEGKKWLGDITDEKLAAKIAEFSEDKGEFHLRQSLSFTTETLVSSDSSAPERRDGKLYVYGPFLVPNKPDKKAGHWVTEVEIMKAVRKMGEPGLEVEHQIDVPDGYFKITQIFVAPGNFRINGKQIAKGSAVAEIEITSPTLKRQIEAGELRGFSIHGSGNVDPQGGLHNIEIEKISLAAFPAIGEEFVVQKSN